MIVTCDVKCAAPRRSQSPCALVSLCDFRFLNVTELRKRFHLQPHRGASRGGFSGNPASTRARTQTRTHTFKCDQRGERGRR